MLIDNFQDKLGWNPVMAATKADSGGEELVEVSNLNKNSTPKS
jgi:hypothetical protein